MKRIHVFNNVEMRFGLRKYTFLVMQKYGHDKSVPYVWRNIRTQFRGRMQPIHGTFVAVFQFVRHIIIIYVTHHRKPSTTHFVNIQCIILNRAQLVYFVMVTHSENKNPIFALQKPYFCTTKTPFLHAKKGGFAL